MLESSKEASTYSRIPEARSAPKVQKEMGEKSISLETSLFLSLTSSKPLVCQEESSPCACTHRGRNGSSLTLRLTLAFLPNLMKKLRVLFV